MAFGSSSARIFPDHNHNYCVESTLIRFDDDNNNDDDDAKMYIVYIYIFFLYIFFMIHMYIYIESRVAS